MKILIVANKGSNHAKKVAEGLAQRGHVVFFASPNDYIDKSVILDRRIYLFTLPYKGKLGYITNFWALKRLYKRLSPDVVNVHYATGCGLLAYLARVQPVVLSCYGSDIFEFPKKRKLNKWLLVQILKSANALASTSNAMADEIHRLLSDSKKEIAITPFGINTNVFFPYQELRSCNRKVIGIVKSLSPIYDIPLLIRAMSIICDKMHDYIYLKIYGDGPQKQELISLATELGISERVIFAGRISNDGVPVALNEMDIFINCSKQESFGVNILEAMACGLPVVATDCAGPREIMIDGVTGIIVKDRDPLTLANAVLSLLNDDLKRKEMGKAGRERVCAYFDWNSNVAELEKVLFDNKKQN